MMHGANMKIKSRFFWISVAMSDGLTAVL